MKKIAVSILLISLLGAYSVQGKDFPRQQPPAASGMIFQLNPQYLPHTGDRDFDSFLIEVNRTAAGSVEQYIGDISTAFHVPREKVILLFAKERMQPADIFMVFQIVRLSGKPYQKIIHHFRQHKGKGWGAVVLSLGIKPGSKRFIVLRQDVPAVIWHYALSWRERGDWNKGSKKKGSKWKKGSKKEKGSKGRK
ncbi:hypothetical protein GCAAIG_01240 [Candidatus Electronema halotolerans]